MHSIVLGRLRCNIMQAAGLCLARVPDGRYSCIHEILQLSPENLPRIFRTCYQLVEKLTRRGENQISLWVFVMLHIFSS